MGQVAMETGSFNLMWGREWVALVKSFKDSYRNIFDRQVGVCEVKTEEIVFYAKEGKC